MNRVSRYGWVLVLIALVALWMRVESQPQGSVVHAAPAAVAPEDLPLPPTTMAVVDVAAIFKGYRAFNDEMAKIKVDIENFDQFVKQETAILKVLSDQLAVLKPDAADYKQLQTEAATKTADLQARVATKKTQLLQTEAETYYDSYKKVEAAVRVIARKRKIGFVLRFNSDDMKRDDRNSVLQGVNRAVITYPTDNDITSQVLAELNRT